MFTLKSLDSDAIPAALEKAHRYRLLNEPEQAESICADILRLQPDNQDALATQILALTDRFSGPRHASPAAARTLVSKLHGEYERHYYAGIIDEREGIAWLRSNRPHCGPAAYDCFRAAMEHFEQAEAVRPAGNNDAILRWNSCVRMIENHPDVVPEKSENDAPVVAGD